MQINSNLSVQLIIPVRRIFVVVVVVVVGFILNLKNPGENLLPVFDLFTGEGGGRGREGNDTYRLFLQPFH